jgi:hypothetical protein
MKLKICLVLLMFLQLAFAQKEYSFTSCNVYQKSDTEKNNFIILTFSDTLNTNHNLKVFLKNDVIVNVFLINNEKKLKYTFEIDNKNFKEFDFSKDLTKYRKEDISLTKRQLKAVCNRFKYYERESEKPNDSTEIEVFKFYKEKQRKIVQHNVSIEISDQHNSDNAIPNDFIFIIQNCIDENFNFKRVKEVNIKSLVKKNVYRHEKLQLVTTENFNFTINLKE